MTTNRVDALFPVVSIPVVVDEPSGEGADGPMTVPGGKSQSLLSWMSPRARAVRPAPRPRGGVSIPVVVDEPSGASRKERPRHVSRVSIPVVVDEPSGGRPRATSG